MPSRSQVDLSSEIQTILGRLEVFGIRLGLEATHRLLELFSNPQSRQPSILIGGTNGKGSTAALLASICTASGYRTGLYTSPHLERVNERIRVDGQDVDDLSLLENLREILLRANDHGLDLPTHFEILTVAAWLAFERAEVDLAIMEVGLGGRLDATNASDPCLSVITSIDFDHEDVLGTTLDAIAAEKAAIFRRERPAIAHGGDEQRRRIFRELATEHGARLTLVDEAVEILPDDESLIVRTARETYQLVVPLTGGHQQSNIGVALLAAEELASQGFERISKEAVERGVTQSHWPGRLEYLKLPNGSRILLDAAHNPAGARALSQYLSDLDEAYTVLFGALETKRIGEMLEALTPNAQTVILTRPSHPMGADLSLKSHPIPNAIWIEDPERALEQALAEPTLVVICGSIYLIGPLRHRLRQRCE